MSADFYHVSELKLSLTVKFMATMFFIFSAYMSLPTTHAYEQEPGQTGALEMTEMDV